jgi:hypothetical protein
MVKDLALVRILAIKRRLSRETTPPIQALPTLFTPDQNNNLQFNHFLGLDLKLRSSWIVQVLIYILFAKIAFANVRYDFSEINANS